MKITKIFVSVFLVAFFVGYVSVLTISKKNEPLSQTTNFTSPILPTLSLESEKGLEIIEMASDSSGISSQTYKIKITETGEDFDREDVEAKNGETWLGLFKDKENYFLRPAKLNISQNVIRGKKDQEAEIKKSIKVNGKTKPLFLLKNFVSPKENKEVSTLYKGMTWSDILENKNQPDFDSYEMLTKLNKNFAENYKIGGNKYTLKVVEAKNKKNAEILALILEGEGKRQIIHTINAKESSDVGYLFWVGDLDSDGKPDFYLSLYETDNISALTLFLSSKAGNDKLIKAVAAFVSMSNC